MSGLIEVLMAPPSNRQQLGPTFQAVLRATATTNFGDGIRLAALPLLAKALTESPRMVAAVAAFQFLPWLVFGPFGGVIVDRSDRRRLILTTQMWRAAVMAALAIAVLTESVSIWMVFTVAFVITVGEILVDPSVVATIPTIVNRQQLDRANGRLSSVELVTNEMIGLPVGAALFAAVPWLPFAIDGATYFGSTASFRHLPAGRPRQHQALDLGEVMAELPQGLRWLMDHPMLGRWTVAVAVFNTGSAAGFSLLVFLIVDVHGGSELTYGVVLAGAAMAGALGSGFAARLVEHHGRARVMLTAAALTATCHLMLAGAPSLVAVIAAWSAVAGLAGVMMAIGRGFVQHYCPNELLGRAAIASRTITRTAFVVGALVGGEVATQFGIRPIFVAAGTIQMAALAPMVLAFRHDTDAVA